MHAVRAGDLVCLPGASMPQRGVAIIVTLESFKVLDDALCFLSKLWRKVVNCGP